MQIAKAKSPAALVLLRSNIWSILAHEAELLVRNANPRRITHSGSRRARVRLEVDILKREVGCCARGKDVEDDGFVAVAVGHGVPARIGDARAVAFTLDGDRARDVFECEIGDFGTGSGVWIWTSSFLLKRDTGESASLRLEAVSDDTHLIVVALSQKDGEANVRHLEIFEADV